MRKKEKEFKSVIDKIKNALGEKVKDVVLSKRLSDSPCCIVVDENDPSLQMERMMKAMGQATFGSVKPILEVNADHPIIAKLKDTEDTDYIADVSSGFCWIFNLFFLCRHIAKCTISLITPPG